jgi:hypothetical protein
MLGPPGQLWTNPTVGPLSVRLPQRPSYNATLESQHHQWGHKHGLGPSLLGHDNHRQRIDSRDSGKFKLSWQSDEVLG